MINLKELYFEILERLPDNARDFLLKRGKDILIFSLVIIIGYVLTLSFIKYQETTKYNASKQLGFAISETDLSKKENMLRQVIKKYSNTPSADLARLLLASLMLDLGKNNEATALFQEAQRNFSKTTIFKDSARIGEAFSILNTKKQDAMSILKEFTKDDNPYAGVALFTLATLLENDGDVSGAKVFYEKYLTLFPNDPLEPMIKEKINRFEMGGNNTSTNG